MSEALSAAELQERLGHSPFIRFLGLIVSEAEPAELRDRLEKRALACRKKKDYATALACHESPEYRHAAKLRDAASVVDLVIVEGYDGPQPG